MQSKGVQLAPLEPRVSCLLEATPERGVVEWDGGMCPPGDQPSAEQHRAEAEGGGLYYGTLHVMSREPAALCHNHSAS